MSKIFLSKTYAPAYMKAVLVLFWKDFVTDLEGEIRRSFEKIKLCPVQHLFAKSKFLGNSCVLLLQCGTGGKSKELENRVI